MQHGHIARWQATALALLAACCASACAVRGLPPPIPLSGTVEGRVRAASGEWVVVYLEGPALARERDPHRGAAQLRSHGGALEPPVLAVAPGQTLQLSSADGLHHRFFSSSRPQGFDPVDVPGGQSRPLTLARPGIVRVYCSLHPHEEGTVVVAPSRHFSTVKAPGGYALREVPPGDYALTTWSERRGPEERPVRVERGEATIVEIELGPGS